MFDKDRKKKDLPINNSSMSIKDYVSVEPVDFSFRTVLRNYASTVHDFLNIDHHVDLVFSS
jgi:hypothetical protein